MIQRRDAPVPVNNLKTKLCNPLCELVNTVLGHLGDVDNNTDNLADM